MHAKPVVVLDPYGTYDRLRQFVDELVEAQLVRPQALSSVHWSTTVEDAFALDRARAGRSSPAGDADSRGAPRVRALTGRV